MLVKAPELTPDPYIRIALGVDVHVPAPGAHANLESPQEHPGDTARRGCGLDIAVEQVETEGPALSARAWWMGPPSGCRYLQLTENTWAGAG